MPSPFRSLAIAAALVLGGALPALAASADPVSAMPLIEQTSTVPGDTLAVLYSGDGGWTGVDKGIAAVLARAGIPMVGVNSLRYFWTERTPQGLASDVDRVLRFYAAHWKKSRALLIGYSQGADVLPFAMNRLPAASRQLVAQVVLMGLGEKASFEFHVANWLGSDDDESLPIRPEATKLTAQTALCLYGADEQDSLCPKLPATSVYAQSLPGGHHFDGAYDELAALILARLR